MKLPFKHCPFCQTEMTQRSQLLECWLEKTYHPDKLFWFGMGEKNEVLSFHCRIKDKQITVNYYLRKTYLYSVKDENIFQEEVFDYCFTLDQILTDDPEKTMETYFNFS